MKTEKWHTGIDPGVRMLGMVLLDPDYELRAWHTFSCPPGWPNVARAEAVGEEVAQRFISWRSRYGLTQCRVGVEMPVYKHNPSTFSLQWRTIQAIEAQLCLMSEVQELYEVSPTASKLKLAKHGQASKKDMVNASPFKNLKETWPIKEALADAYAHCLVAIDARLDIQDVSLNLYAEINKGASYYGRD